MCIHCQECCNVNMFFWHMIMKSSSISRQRIVCWSGVKNMGAMRVRQIAAAACKARNMAKIKSLRRRSKPVNFDKSEHAGSRTRPHCRHAARKRCDKPCVQEYGLCICVVLHWETADDGSHDSLHVSPLSHQCSRVLFWLSCVLTISRLSQWLATGCEMLRVSE